MQVKQTDGSLIEVPIHGLNLNDHFRVTELMAGMKEADTAKKRELIAEAAKVCIPGFDPATSELTMTSIMQAIAASANDGKVTSEERKKSD